MFVFPALLFCFFPVFASHPYLLIEKPWKLEIRNQFEQKLTGSDFQLIKPYRPAKLVSKSETLSDGLSKAMVIEIEGKRFYILLNGTIPINKNSSGEWIQTEPLRPESGSATLVKAVKLQSVGLQNAGEAELSAGTEVEKVASLNGRVLVWISLLNRSGWVSEKQLTSSLSEASTSVSKPKQIQNPDSLEWVNQVISESNQIIKLACELTGQNPISFILQQQKKGWLITVDGAPPFRFERSFDSLSRKLSLYASLHSFSVSLTDEGIWLERKSE